jgi:hypothetical protein
VFTGKGTVQGRGTRAQLGRRLGASVSAVALAVLLTGNVAARPLDREDHGSGALVSPRLNSSISGQWTKFKLATHAGYRVLVFE